MADINSVVSKIKDALTEAETVVGGATTADTIAALQAQVTQLSTDKAGLVAEITLVKSDLVALQTALDKAKSDAV